MKMSYVARGRWVKFSCYAKNYIRAHRIAPIGRNSDLVQHHKNVSVTTIMADYCYFCPFFFTITFILFLVWTFNFPRHNMLHPSYINFLELLSKQRTAHIIGNTYYARTNFKIFFFSTIRKICMFNWTTQLFWQ